VFTRQIFLLSCTARLHSLMMEQILQSDRLYTAFVHLSCHSPSEEQIDRYKKGKTNVIQVQVRKITPQERTSHIEIQDRAFNVIAWKDYVANWPIIENWDLELFLNKLDQGKEEKQRLVQEKLKQKEEYRMNLKRRREK
jgi:hypothetical protein